MSQESEDYITPIFPVSSEEEIEQVENDSTESMDDFDENEFTMLGGAARRLWPTVEQYKAKFLGMFGVGYSSTFGKTYLPVLSLSDLVPNVYTVNNTRAKLPTGDNKSTTLDILLNNKLYIPASDSTPATQGYEIKELKKTGGSADFADYPKIFPATTATTPVFYLSVFLTKALEKAIELTKKKTISPEEKDTLLLLGEIIVRLYILCYINIFTQNDFCVEKPTKFSLYNLYVGEGMNRVVKFSEFLGGVLDDLEDPDSGIKLCLFGKDTALEERTAALEGLYDLLKDYGMIYFFNDVLNVKYIDLKEYSKTYFFEDMSDFLKKMKEEAVKSEAAAKRNKNEKDIGKKHEEACKTLKTAIDKLPEAKRKALTDGDIASLTEVPEEYKKKETIQECFDDYDTLFPAGQYGFASPPPATDICEHLKKEIDSKITKKEDRLKITKDQIKLFMKPDGKTPYTKAEVEACLKAKKGDVPIFLETEYKLAPEAGPASSFTAEQEKLVIQLIAQSPTIPKISKMFIEKKLVEIAFKNAGITLDIVKAVFQKINTDTKENVGPFKDKGVGLEVDEVVPTTETKKFKEIVARGDGWCFYNSIVRQLTNDEDENQIKKEEKLLAEDENRSKALATEIKDYINLILAPNKKKLMAELYNILYKPNTYIQYLNDLDDKTKKVWADPDFGVGLGAAYRKEIDITIYVKGPSEGTYQKVTIYTFEDSQKSLASYKSSSKLKPARFNINLLYVDKTHYNILLEVEPTAADDSTDAAVTEMKTELPAFLDSIVALKTLINENKELKVKKAKEGGGEEEEDLFTPDEKTRIGEIIGFFDTEMAKLSGDVTKDNFAEKEKTLLAIVDKLNGEIVQSILVKLIPQLRSEEAKAKYNALKKRKIVIPTGVSAASSSAAAAGDKWEKWYTDYGEYVLKAMASFAADAKTVETYLTGVPKSNSKKLSASDENSLKTYVIDVVGTGSTSDSRVNKAKDIIARIKEKLMKEPKEKIELDVKLLGDSLFEMNKGLYRLAQITKKISKVFPPNSKAPEYIFVEAAKRIEKVAEKIPETRFLAGREGALSRASNAAAEETPYMTDLLAIGVTGDYGEGTLGGHISTFEVPRNVRGGAKSKRNKKGSRKNRKQDRKTRKVGRGRNTRRKNRKA